MSSLDDVVAVDQPSAGVEEEYRLRLLEVEAMEQTMAERMEAAVLAGDCVQLGALILQRQAGPLMRLGLFHLEAGAWSAVWRRRLVHFQWLMGGWLLARLDAAEPAGWLRMVAEDASNMVQLWDALEELARASIPMILRGSEETLDKLMTTFSQKREFNLDVWEKVVASGAVFGLDLSAKV